MVIAPAALPSSSTALHGPMAAPWASGTCATRINLLPLPADTVASDAAHAASKELTREVIALGGTCTGEHGIGIGKRQALVDQAGESTVAVMRAVKHAFDPGNILNPGKVLA